MRMLALQEHELSLAGEPARSLAGLRYARVEHERLPRLPGARVVFADYGLLRHDFPSLPRARRDADQWLVDHCGVLSRAQAVANPYNRDVRTTDVEVHAYRPAVYGRAVVVPAGGGMLDVKGVGVAPGAIPAHPRTGLLTLRDALKDSAMQWLTDAAFRHAGEAFLGVPLYAVLDLGIRDRRGRPLGVQVRRAHSRPADGEDMPPFGSPLFRLRLHVERVLRRYGITSSMRRPRMTLERKDGRMLVGNPPDASLTEAQLEEIGTMTGLPEGRFRLDTLNVQFAGEPAETPSPRGLVVDFQEFVIRPRFDRPVVNIVSDRPIGWGGAAWPGDPDFVQPRRGAVPSGVWRRIVTWSTELAAGHAAGRIAGDAVLRAIRRAVRQGAAAWGEERSP
jgi:hypothetical protein